MLERLANQVTYKVALPNGQRRLRELVVYISEKCAGDPWYGSTKLNKILFYADFLSFQSFGEPITGEEYQRIPHGPAPRAMKPLLHEMSDQKEIVIRERDHYGKTQRRPTPLRTADLTIFNGRDIALVDHVIDQLWGKSATEVSWLSHGPWWKTRFDGDSIPYEAAYLSAEPINEMDIRRTGELVKEFGWDAASEV